MSEGCCPGNGLDALELWGEAVNQYDRVAEHSGRRAA